MSITVDKTIINFFRDKITNTKKIESKCPLLLFTLFVVNNLNVRIYINMWSIKWLKDSLLPFDGFLNRLLGPFDTPIVMFLRKVEA